MASSCSVFNYNETSNVETVQRLLSDNNGECEGDCDPAEEQVINEIEN